MTAARSADLRPPSPARGAAFVATGSVAVVAVAVVVWVLVFFQADAIAAPFEPGVDDGRLPSPVSLDEPGVSALVNLDPQLRSALDEAADAAAAEGVHFEVTSGWRTARYQQWLLEQAVDDHGSVEAALQWVAAPDRSHHVTGDAVDIGPVDAQLWLSEHGATWGLCQIYANERWHFELATEPGGTCPPLRENAAG